MRKVNEIMSAVDANQVSYLSPGRSIRKPPRRMGQRRAAHCGPAFAKLVSAFGMHEQADLVEPRKILNSVCSLVFQIAFQRRRAEKTKTKKYNVLGKISLAYRERY